LRKSSATAEHLVFQVTMSYNDDDVLQVLIKMAKGKRFEKKK